jgi:hypothetical protein
MWHVALVPLGGRLVEHEVRRTVAEANDDWRNDVTVV